MARRPTQPRITNRFQDQLLRQNFLQIVNRICPEVFSTLREQELEFIGVHLQWWDPTILPQDFPDVTPSKLAPFLASSVHIWATKFGVEDTWIEEEVKPVLDSWFRHPELRTAGLESLPLCVTSQNDFSEPLLNFSIPVPNALGFDRHTFSWSALEQHLREQASLSIEAALRQLKAEALRYGVLTETKQIDFNSQMFRALALYLFGNKSTQEIGAVAGLAADRTTVWRWIKEASRAIDLSEAVARRRSARIAAAHRATKV